MSDERRAKAFEDLLIAAMKDAAVEGKLTHFKVAITPDESVGPKFIRIIVTPDEMEYQSPDPLGFQSNVC